MEYRRRRATAKALSLCVTLIVGVLGTVSAHADTSAFAGAVDAAGDSWDTHTFAVTDAGVITATLSWTGAANLNLGLKDPTGTWVTWAASPTANPEQIIHDTTLTGTWTLGVAAKTGSASYTLDVTAPTQPPPPPTDTFTGTLDAAGDAWDTHTIAVTSAGVITATLSWTGAANLNLGLKDPTGTWVTWAASPTANPEQIIHDTTLTGTWTLGVAAKTGSATYTLDVTTPGGSGGGGGPVTPTYVRTIGAAAHAQMYPSGLDLGPTGVLYVADTGNDRIAAFDSAGTLLWSTGDRSGRKPGSFSNPRDVAVASGMVFAGDTAYSRIQVLDASDGSYLAAWSTHFSALMGVSAGVDGSGTPVILVTDGNTSRITVHALDGTLLRTIGSFGTGAGQLNEPRDAATDAAGNIYVADFRNHRVARFSPAGTWLGSWGVLGSGPGQFNAPYGIDLDAAGNIYVADSNNSRIQKLAPDGSFVRSWGSAGAGVGQFFQLRRVAVGAGASPDVLGADLWGDKIERFGQGGAVIATYGGVPAADGGFNEPYGVSLDATHVFVTDTTNQRVERFSSSGTWQLTWGIRGWGDDLLGLNWPRDVAYMAATDRVWVADTKNSRVTEYTTGGAATGRTLGTPGTGQGQLQWPHAVAAYGADLIIADTNNHRIKRWDPDGGAGSGLVWMATGFLYPKDVSVLGDVVYVADSLNGRVVRLDAITGAFIDSFGAAALHQPEGIAVSPSGSVWVADTPWNRLVEFTPAGTWSQTFGSMGSAHGRFNRPEHLEIQSTATATLLYVVDEWNDRVEVFDLGG